MIGIDLICVNFRSTFHDLRQHSWEVKMCIWTQIIKKNSTMGSRLMFYRRIFRRIEAEIFFLTNQTQFVYWFNFFGYSCSIWPYRFCVGDKFYLCDNKILCEYDYEERLVFATMANHPILKRHASGSLPGTPPNSIPNIPTSSSSPVQQNGHHHGMLSNIGSQRSQNNDMNNNQNGLNGVTSPFGTPTHMKQVITTNWNQHQRWHKWNG